MKECLSSCKATGPPTAGSPPFSAYRLDASRFAFIVFAKCSFVNCCRTASPFFLISFAAASSTSGPAPFGSVIPASFESLSISIKNE